MININNKIRTRFIHWYNEVFCASECYMSMTKIVEASPWHRERNVGVHTDMVVNEFISRSDHNWDVYTLMGALVCAYHDVGKPMSEEVKFSEKRGEYRSYNGHEKRSARLWEDIWCSDSHTLNEYFPELDVKKKLHISWLIEYHVPWGITRPDKRLMLARTVLDIFGRRNEVFCRILLSDTYGRISDDYDTKHKNAESWCYEFMLLINQTCLKEFDVLASENQPILLMPIGASGCGKSTYYDVNSLASVYQYYSWDKLRLDMYVDGDKSRVKDAFELSIGDKDFTKKVHAEFITMVKKEKSIYVDNTNLSKKRRAFFIMEARKRGYWIVAVRFPISMSELMDRQSRRGNKAVPFNSVNTMYMALQEPLIGEFDEVLYGI